MSSETMNVLWTKNKKNPVILNNTGTHPADASGDARAEDTVVRCCRLCGGCRDLRPFCEPCFCMGVQERYDHMFSECFPDLTCPKGGKICDCCVKLLRNFQSFRALVDTAFERDPNAEPSSLTVLATQESMPLEQESQVVSPEKEIFDLLQMDEGRGKKQRRILDSKIALNNAKVGKNKTFVPYSGCRQSVRPIKVISPDKVCKPEPNMHNFRNDDLQRRGAKKPVRRETKITLNVMEEPKKAFIPCIVCNQRYQMMLPSTEWNTFVCPRCKNHITCHISNPVMPAYQFQRHKKAENKEKARMKKVLKKNTNEESNTIQNRPQVKNKCSLCSKVYVVAKNLEQHMANVHARECFCCTNEICGKNPKTKEFSDQHWLTHTSKNRDTLGRSYNMVGKNLATQGLFQPHVNLRVRINSK